MRPGTDRACRARAVLARGLQAGALLVTLAVSVVAHAAPLPSWNDGAARERILAFVRATTDPASKDFVPPAERIAVFDNDGTLWAEHPMYVQLAFVIDRVHALAPQHPEWKSTQPFKAVLDGDLAALAAQGEKGLIELLSATHTGMTIDAFDAIVEAWIKGARHPRFGRPYTEVIYQPMLELLAYLRENGFKTYIVSGGGVEFMRVWAERVYGVPPEQVVGSAGKLQLETRDGKPVLMKIPGIDLVDDGPGKPVGIQKHIGRRPIAAFGNSDGDLQMLEYVASGPGARLALIVHHTDAEREYAYDRKSSFGKLDKALDAASAQGWVVVDTKSDWKKIFAFE